MNVLAISYGKNLFSAGIERDRQLACAEAVTSLHTIVFLKQGTAETAVEGNFHLYPSGGRSKIGRLIAAYRTGANILRKRDIKESWVITTQDPFEAGLVGYLLARRFGVPLNIQEHGDFFSTPHWARESLLNQVRVRFGRWLLLRADTVRVVSNRIKATMLKIGVLAPKIRQLAVAVPLQNFAPAQTPPATANDELVTVITVARLVAQKNLLLLLQAFAKVSAEFPQARLVIVGSGPQESVLHREAEKINVGSSNLVAFMPWSDDVPDLLKTADIYALSSNYEGYARVIPEAMATGLPIVMTDVGCAGELCLDGVHGAVVPVGGMDAFSEALKTLVSSTSLRTRYGTAGVVTVASNTNALTEYPQAWRDSLL
jgi:glycosyltransferase involved in cell wall biosynthesis